MKKLLLSGAVLIASFTNIHAQWIEQLSNVTQGYYVPFLDAVNDSIVWGIVSDPAAQTNAVAEFTKTIDGGNNWIDGQISNAAGLAPACISAINADTAWAAMWNVTGGAGKILQTTDGGVTWNQQTTALFNAPGNFPDFVYFWNANNGVCLGDPPTGSYFEIYTTVDGGTTWVRTDSLDIPAQLTGEFGITDVFRNEGDSTLFYGTNMGRIYKTTDRGLHWTVAQTPFTDFIGAIAFRDANNGLCVSGGTIGSTDVAYTTDGGATWNLRGTNTTMNLILGLCYVPGTDSTYFISTPANGSVDGTTFSINDGTTWNLVDNLIHTDIEFTDDSTGYTGSNMTDINFNNLMYKWSSSLIFPPDDAASKTIDTKVVLFPATVNPIATFTNMGENTNTFDVTMIISGGYTSTKTITNLPFYNSQQVAFDPWTPAAYGDYTVTIYTSLTGDAKAINDTVTGSIAVYDEFPNYGWISKPPLTTGTYGLAGAFNLLGNTSSSPGSYYSIGGADFTALYPTLNIFNTQPNNWTVNASMPTAKYQFSAQEAGGKVYAAGGYFSGFNPDLSNYIYDPATTLWTTGSPMPTPVGDYASGVYNDSLIYFIAGYAGNGIGDQNIVQIYNTITDTWSSATPKPGIACAGLRGSIYQNKIIITGGYAQVGAKVLADAYLGVIDNADPTQITWTQINDFPPGTVSRLGAGVPFRGLKPLIVFTGGDPTGGGVNTLGECFAYDFTINRWRWGPDKITPVSNISDFVGLVYNDSAYMASASGYDGVNISTVHEWLNLGSALGLGINEHNSVSNDLITLYPNPANDQLIISIKDKADVSMLHITDVSGRIVKTTTVSKGQSTVRINLTNIDAGVYFVSVAKENGDTGGYLKFVKE